ncbi:MAG: hypothetical protein B6I17_03425 [Tenericutes bacterium 4572_104]|nr:MAG: hypothetical protein B6I17_03425 [Tenericutes bacterium 4572_104]
MLYSELGFDFSNINTCAIYKKNNLLKLILFILIFTFFSLFLTFFILYLFRIDMNFNGVSRHFNDPIYQNFFYKFFTIIGLIILISIFLLIVTKFQKRNLYIVVDKDIHLNKFYYIFDKRLNIEIYFSDELAILYKSSYDKIEVHKDLDKIDFIKEKYIFWLNFNKAKIDNIKRKEKKTVFKLHDDISNRFLSVYKKYIFSNFIQNFPTKILEYIYIRSGNSNRIKSISVYYLESINQHVSYTIHPKIKKSLSEI